MTAKLTKVTSSHWGAFEVTTEGGRIVGVSEFREDPNSLEYFLSPARSRTPPYAGRATLNQAWLA
ncbi:MAG: hypothetical protein Ct9H300mP16_17590 [Pseudomonadota bacterium]|nr:MAG: hypothetical protein Ct9H300mP16_17590 [Pseudomonadota bacterium]